jgi:hypothetical protein
MSGRATAAPGGLRWGIVAGLLFAGCRSETATTGYRDGVDAGYVLGSADAVKRLYWAKQALEHPPAPVPVAPGEP